MARIAGLARLLGIAATEIKESAGEFDRLENTKAGQKLDALIN
ncbi:MAG: hypothetical protein AAF844_21165 [Pseudomonadota bacterium]